MQLVDITKLQFTEDRIKQFFKPFETLSIDVCWNRSPKSKNRYSVVYIGGKNIRSSRFAYLAFYKSLPTDKYVCHKCDNDKCVNPHHLFLGTQLDNMTDMIKKDRLVSHNKLKTHCKIGHEFNESNTVFYNDSKTGKQKRYCKPCEKLRDKIKIQKRKVIK